MMPFFSYRADHSGVFAEESRLTSLTLNTAPLVDASRCLDIMSPGSGFGSGLSKLDVHARPSV